MFFDQLVKPILKKHYPYLKYSAGLLGPGSDVIGFDTPRSMDHDWGPRVAIFLPKKDERVSKKLNKELPVEFKGFSVIGVEVHTISSFFEEYLHFDISKKVTAEDWLVFPEHKLLTITEGDIFHDDLGLKKIVKRFEYYPKDI